MLLTARHVTNKRNSHEIPYRVNTAININKWNFNSFIRICIRNKLKLPHIYATYMHHLKVRTQSSTGLPNECSLTVLWGVGWYFIMHMGIAGLALYSYIKLLYNIRIYLPLSCLFSFFMIFIMNYYAAY